MIFALGFYQCALSKESIILVRWLAGVTAAEAARVNTEHAHLRAAVFLGLDKLRKTYSRAGPFLTQEQRATAVRYNLIFHSALNCYSLSFTRLKGRVGVYELYLLSLYSVFVLSKFSGLAAEAINSGKILWKVRPKDHQTLG